VVVAVTRVSNRLPSAGSSSVAQGTSLTEILPLITAIKIGDLKLSHHDRPEVTRGLDLLSGAQMAIAQLRSHMTVRCSIMDKNAQECHRQLTHLELVLCPAIRTLITKLVNLVGCTCICAFGSMTDD
jgi:hypothetical protein